MSKSLEQTSKIAIVLPVYNVEKYLKECINSILKQTHSNFAIFAVDDGSTDSSGQILDDFSKNDNRLRVIHQSNQGASSARNKALDLIENIGDFEGVCFLDSDDWITEDYLETFISLSREYNAEYIVCGWDFFDKKGFNHIKRNHYAAHPTAMISSAEAFQHFLRTESWSSKKSKTFSLGNANIYYKTSCIKGIRFNTTLKRAEDQGFRIQAMSRIKKGVICSKSTYMYRLRSSSLSHSGNDMSDDLFLAINLFDQKNSFPEHVRHYIDLFLFKAWWGCTRLAYSNNNLKQQKSILDIGYKKICSPLFKLKISAKMKMKLFFYSLGLQPLKIYLGLKKDKFSSEIPNAYE